LPEGAVSKDGPSAGVTIFVALVSAFTERAIRTDVAMTGEINLNGEILAIGGLKSKLATAVREGIKTVLIPEANKNSIDKIPQEIKDKLEIILVEDLNGVLSHVLV
jgi:ATP-dependent Lon protease